MTGLARRYARALAEVAGADAGPALSQVEILRDALLAEPAIRKALENPAISVAEKEGLLHSLEEKAGVLPVVVRLLALLASRRRVAMLGDVALALRDIRDAEEGLVRAHLYTARPLSGPQVAAFRVRLEAALKQPVALETAVRSELIAGAQLQVGSTVYDGSVSGALKALRSSLVKGSA
jgi:F-type H+-transporting ATPase subunit delta